MFIYLNALDNALHSYLYPPFAPKPPSFTLILTASIAPLVEIAPRPGRRTILRVSGAEVPFEILLTDSERREVKAMTDVS
jgi:hypothetical protein